MANQQWWLRQGTTVRLGANYKYCLDTAGGKTDSNTAVTAAACTGSMSQQWIFKKNTLRPASVEGSSNCLDGGSLGWGNGVMLWDCNGQDQQQVEYDANSGTIWFTQSPAPHMCLNLRKAPLLSGEVEVSGCNDLAAEVFSGASNQCFPQLHSCYWPNTFRKHERLLCS